MSDIYTFVLLEYLAMGYLCIPVVFGFLITIELLLFHSYIEEFWFIGLKPSGEKQFR